MVACLKWSHCICHPVLLLSLRAFRFVFWGVPKFEFPRNFLCCGISLKMCSLLCAISTTMKLSTQSRFIELFLRTLKYLCGKTSRDAEPVRVCEKIPADWTGRLWEKILQIMSTRKLYKHYKCISGTKFVMQVWTFPIATMSKTTQHFGR